MYFSLLVATITTPRRSESGIGTSDRPGGHGAELVARPRQLAAGALPHQPAALRDEDAANVAHLGQPVRDRYDDPGGAHGPDHIHRPLPKEDQAALPPLSGCHEVEQ